MKKESEDNKMDNNLKFFWLMRRQTLEEELNKCKKLKEMIDMSRYEWSGDYDASLVATELRLRIDELEKEIAETPSLE